jgi:hypothetical protein
VKKSTHFRVRAICTLVLLGLPLLLQSQKEYDVKLIRNDDSHKVDVIINNALFTAYNYPSDIEKPFLFPLISPDGSTLTRGFPIEPRAGERVDHPHHIGLWFNHGNVNGLDFWNNSSDIPAANKDKYGHIVHKGIIASSDGRKGILEVELEWQNSKGHVVLTENTRYIFSGDEYSRTIDHISVLKAVDETVIFNDSKEGLFAIRVDRAFEMPSNESLLFTDSQGNPTTVKKTDNKGVSGMYFSSNGLKGDSVWGTRNDWVMLQGKKNDAVISMAMFDNRANPGYPAYAHARGYGLFSINNLGQNSYDPKKENRSLKLEKGQSVTLYHRFYVQTGKALTAEEANRIFEEFNLTSILKP